MIDNRPKTIFCDLDGTLFYEDINLSNIADFNKEQVLLPGVSEKLLEWYSKGHYIILTTARKESSRELTKKQLVKLGVHYDQLIMGITHGQRVLINNRKDVSSPYHTELYAKAINVNMNMGLEGIDL